MELTIRKLTVADNDRLTDLLLKLSGRVEFSGLRSAVKTESESGDAKPAADEELAAYFVGLLHTLFTAYRSDLRPWFADLVGITYEQYMTEAPFDADMVIIEQIKEAPGFISFFVKACAVFRLQGILAKITKSVKGSFASLTS